MFLAPLNYDKYFNKEEDFQEFMDDEVFCQIMKRINKKELTQDDFLYIENETEVREEVERYERHIYKDGKLEGEKSKALEIAGRLKARGFDDETIAEASGLSREEVAQL